jgi:hypothetical protein
MHFSRRGYLLLPEIPVSPGSHIQAPGTIPLRNAQAKSVLELAGDTTVDGSGRTKIKET